MSREQTEFLQPVGSEPTDARAAATNPERDEGGAEPVALVLNDEDYMHVVTLLDLALNELPNTTDEEVSRSSLRAVRDFLSAHARDIDTPFTAGGANEEAPEWTPCDERVTLALYASWDIESCLDPAMKLLRAQDGAMPDDHAVMLALLLRVKTLDSVIMSALGDDSESVESIQRRFEGSA